jgi:SAM-dependent methyltransferase
MTTPEDSANPGYRRAYEEFDSALMQQIRRESYGTDIGQHSWVTAEDLEEDMARLELSPASRLLDLGCGPGGPLTFIAGRSGCHGCGADVSPQAIAAGRARAAALGLEGRVSLQEADLNKPLPFETASFDAVMSLDVILHLRDRLAVFREVARVLVPGARFLFTDAGVVTGSISNEEIRLRSLHGHSQFAAPGFNERMLELAGLQLIDRSDRTASLLKNATGRLAARQAHRAALEQVEGSASYEREQQYLHTVIALSERGALARRMYLAKSRSQ